MKDKAGRVPITLDAIAKSLEEIKKDIKNIQEDLHEIRIKYIEQSIPKGQPFC